jgi:tetratricopeptide (TPR) repeat protein
MYLNGKKASEIFPAQPLVYLFAGIGAKEKKLYEEAEEWFFLGKELVIRDVQLSSEFLYHLGDMNYQLGNDTEGDFYFQEALKAFPGNEHVHGAIAKTLIDAKQLDAAEIELIKALELSPKSIVLHEIYGDLLFNKKEYAKAANHFLRALLDNYAEFELLEKYGDALFLSGEETKALDVWAEAIRNGNKSVILQRKLADKKYSEAN